MKITKEELASLVHGETDSSDTWKVLDDSVIDDWRWGTVSQIALEHKSSSQPYGYTYREQTGDEYYNSINDLADGEEIELYPVESTMVIRYRRAEG
jgi:hypothetical protein